MATKSDIFPSLAMKQAVSREVIELFSQLAERAEKLAKMQDENLELIILHREQRTGKKFAFTKRQNEFMEEAERDAEKARLDTERHVKKMDDVALVASALSGEKMLLDFEKRMFPVDRPQDKKAATEIIQFREETFRLIENFVNHSPLKGKIESQLNMIGFKRQ